MSDLGLPCAACWLWLPPSRGRLRSDSIVEGGLSVVVGLLGLIFLRSLTAASTRRHGLV